MKQTKRPVNLHKVYHAHVYFDDKTAVYARELCNSVDQNFGLKVGRFHEKLVGPHPRWSCQITFGKKDFEAFIPWLDESRQELTVFVHALTGDDLKDHTDFAYWLGQEVELNLDIFR